ncbi:hypothetical protein EBF04_08060 [Streptomyces sp. I6]|nr:hypothetical protein EBF04_08060 [Streptomyces sp. I6]
MAAAGSGRESADPPDAVSSFGPVAGMAESATGIPAVVAIAESYAPHSGHVTAPLRGRWQGAQ